MNGLKLFAGIALSELRQELIFPLERIDEVLVAREVWHSSDKTSSRPEVQWEKQNASASGAETMAQLPHHLAF